MNGCTHADVRRMKAAPAGTNQPKSFFDGEELKVNVFLCKGGKLRQHIPHMSHSFEIRRRQRVFASVRSFMLLLF